jgi:hypothetical protein
MAVGTRCVDLHAFYGSKRTAMFKFVVSSSTSDVLVLNFLQYSYPSVAQTALYKHSFINGTKINYCCDDISGTACGW